MKFVKKPVVIEAFKWIGGIDQTEDPEWACEAVRKGEMFFEHEGTERVLLKIKTLEGVMTAQRGDWIIKGIKGEIYPCKPEIFEATYDLILDGSK